jgi:hypothetical protein
MTPLRKQEIYEVFEKWMASPDDVLGPDDINALLNKHPKVEQTHYKLWLTSSAVLERVLHSEIFNRSDDLVDRIRQDLRLYVQNPSLQRAVKLLGDEHVCIITGGPGIGKTLLANMLLVHHLAREWSAIAVSSDIEEAERVWRRDEKQIFYYDDFLGTVLLSRAGLRKNEDARLLNFIERVHRDPQKRLVLTTREYILRDAKLVYERLDEARLEPMQCVIKLEDYTRLVRAQILYNHLYFSTLPGLLRTALNAGRTYRRVISHRNYSPRLISYITTPVRPERPADGAGFVKFVFDTLDNPTRLWEYVFNNHLNDTARAILLGLITMPQPSLLEDLQQVVAKQLPQMDGDAVAFKQAYKLLDGTLIATSAADDRTIVAQLKDPSVSDFLLNWLIANRGEIKRLLENAEFFEQCSTIWGISQATIAAGEFASAPRLRPQDLPLEALLSAMRRTFRLKGAEVFLYLDRESRETSHRRIRHSLTFRAQAIIDVADETQTAGALEAAKSALDAVPDEWRSPGAAKHSAVELMKRISMCREPLRSVLDFFVLEVKAWFAGDLVSTSDFVAILALNETWPQLLTRREVLDIEEAFSKHMDAETDYLMDSGTADELQTSIDDLRSVAAGLHVDAEPALRQLQGRLDDVMAEIAADKDEDDWRDVSDERPSGMSSEDQEIDSLFDSLAEAAQSDPR